MVFAFSVIPSYNIGQDVVKEGVDYNELQMLYWLRDNIEEDATVLSTVEEGHLINSIAHGKNVMDNAFLLAPDPVKRYDDVNLMYTSASRARAISLFRKYIVKYIYFSDRAKSLYQINEIGYIDDVCFQKVKENEKIKIYKFIC